MKFTILLKNEDDSIATVDRVADRAKGPTDRSDARFDLGGIKAGAGQGAARTRGSTAALPRPSAADLPAVRDVVERSRITARLVSRVCLAG